MHTVDPHPERLASFLEAEDDSPIVMINLLRYRERAAYPAGHEAPPCGGREAYQRYGRAVAPLIAQVGGRMLWAGSVLGSLIAPDGEAWDDAVLVEYPSRAAFVEMVSSEAYRAIAVHRTAALLDSRLVATRGLAGAPGPNQGLAPGAR